MAVTIMATKAKVKEKPCENCGNGEADHDKHTVDEAGNPCFYFVGAAAKPKPSKSTEVRKGGRLGMRNIKRGWWN